MLSDLAPRGGVLPGVRSSGNARSVTKHMARRVFLATLSIALLKLGQFHKGYTKCSKVFPTGKNLWYPTNLVCCTKFEEFCVRKKGPATRDYGILLNRSPLRSGAHI